MRDEGGRVTVTVKEESGEGLARLKELEFEASDFDQVKRFLEAIGLTQKAYQERRREEWRLGEAQITLDTWPGLKPFTEIEADSEAAVRKTAERLGLDFARALFGSMEVLYERELGIPPKVINDATPNITFENPPQRRTGA